MPKVEITGEIIKSGVARKLAALPFAAGRVYKEPQSQNINGDAFYITERRVSQLQQISSIVLRRHEIIVRYEPDIEAPKQFEKCAEMGNLLLFELRTIDSGNGVLINGQDMSHEIVDNVALIYVTYPIRIKMEPDDRNPMNHIVINKEVY